MLTASASNAADDSNLAEMLAKYHDTGGADKCKTVNRAARHAAQLKANSDLSVEQLKQKIHGYDSLSSDEKEVYAFMVEIAFSPEQIDKGRREFRNDIKDSCYPPEEVVCDRTLVTSAAVMAKFKATEEAGVSEGYLGRLERKFFKKGTGIWDKKNGSALTHLDMLNMAFWPEHVDKTPEEFVEYVENVWCKIPRIEREKTYSKNELGYGHFFYSVD